MKKVLVLLLTIILILFCFAGCAASDLPTDSNQEVEEKKETEVIEWWSELKEPELKNDIVKAFEEIGEKPEYIISIEHVKDRKTDLFVRREYKVCFDKGDIFDLIDEDDKHFIHAAEWRITTEEWNEGEPEREQYPREYLVTIKFWFDDDTTNVLQWSHTGNGE